MESKELHFDNLTTLRSRVRRPPLQLDSTKLLTHEVAPDDSLSSRSASTKSPSPSSPNDSEPPSISEQIPESPDTESGKEPSTGPQRSRQGSVSSIKDGKEKRKRSRVTPEQLTHLERFFLADRSPTAARRREISELLGMQERQTQIWFQNRRAKAKLLDGKKGRPGDWSDTPPDTPPQLSAGYEAELQNLIHEDEAVTIIPCSDLSIGTWRRIATALGRHDLVAYVCAPKRCLTWFIHSAGYGFKMEIPFETVIHTEFRNASPGQGLASFTLSQPPSFYLENITSPRVGGGMIKSWKRCADWTEGMQATTVLRHDLIGSAVQLAHVVQDLQDLRNGSNIQLLTPPYSHSGSEPGTSMQLPQPPLASIGGNGLRPHPHRPNYMGHGRKRSYSGPPAFTPQSISPHEFSSLSIAVAAHPEPPVSAGFSTVSFSHSLSASSSTPYPRDFNHRVVSDPSTTDISQQQTHPSLVDYNHVPISHAAATRSYATSPTGLFLFDDRPSNTYPLEALHRHSAPATAQLPFDTPSPGLLPPSFSSQGSTSPSLQHIDSVDQTSRHVASHSPPSLSGLAALPYSGHEDIRGSDGGVHGVGLYVDNTGGHRPSLDTNLSP